MHDNIKLQELTEQWSYDRGILTNGKIITQAMKLFEEGGELASAIAKDDIVGIKDGIGDMIVVLTNISKLAGTNLNECWNEAYNDIKDRKGILTADGIFVKSTDARYEQLIMEME